MLDQVSRAILQLYRISRDCRPTEFQDAAFEIVKSVVSFDSGMWVTGIVVPEGDDAVIHTLHLHNQSMQMIADWRRTMERTSFTQKVIRAAGETLGVSVSEEFGPSLAEHARRYNVAHILATATVDAATSLNEIISLWRADAARPFTGDERLMQQALVPHLTESWRINRMGHLAGASQSACSGAACAAVDGRGVLHLAEPAFTRRLLDEWPGWHGPRVPDALTCAIATDGGEYVGEKIVVRVSRLHDQYLLRCRSKSPIDALGTRKREVARYFSQGYSHKEIAHLLGLSPATVRNYLSAIYSVLKIRSKAELATILNES